MDRKLMAALAMIGLLAGVLIAVVVMGGGASDGLTPPCPDGYSETPDGRACASDAEACYAYYDGPITRRVTCTAESRDGHGFVQFGLEGRGSAQVIARDAEGNVAYQRALSWSEPLEDVDEFRAPQGTWTLEVAFNTQSGGGRIYLYG